jgi:hypothetical protein
MSGWFPNRTPDETAELIRNGKGSMPSFRNLPDQDVADILAWSYATFEN